MYYDINLSLIINTEKNSDGRQKVSYCYFLNQAETASIIGFTAGKNETDQKSLSCDADVNTETERKT